MSGLEQAHVLILPPSGKWHVQELNWQIESVDYIRFDECFLTCQHLKASHEASLQNQMLFVLFTLGLVRHVTTPGYLTGHVTTFSLDWDFITLSQHIMKSEDMFNTSLVIR